MKEVRCLKGCAVVLLDPYPTGVSNRGKPRPPADSDISDFVTDHKWYHRPMLKRGTPPLRLASFLLPSRPHTSSCVLVSSFSSSFHPQSGNSLLGPPKPLTSNVDSRVNLRIRSTETQFDRGEGDVTVSSRLPSSTRMAPGITQPMSHTHRHDVDDRSDNAKDEGRCFARDIERKIVGPMPADLFLETFFPHQTRAPRFEDVTFSGASDKPGRESAIYSPLVSSVVPSSLHPFHSPPRRMN